LIVETIRIDRNRYSVAAKAAGQPVQVRAYAERVVIRLDGEVVGEHARQFGRDKTTYDPGHYLHTAMHPSPLWPRVSFHATSNSTDNRGRSWHTPSGCRNFA
jgi:hypothetical protein